MLYFNKIAALELRPLKLIEYTDFLSRALT